MDKHTFTQIDFVNPHGGFGKESNLCVQTDMAYLHTVEF